MKAKSIRGNSTAEIKSALEQAIEDGFVPTLAFVFMSVKQDIPAISDMLDKKQIAIFGATSSGEFIDGQLSSEGIVILLLDMDRSNFTILLEEYTTEPESTAAMMAKKGLDVFDHPSFIISYGTIVASGLIIGESILDGIESVAGKEVAIWGGVAGDDLQFNETLVFTNNGILKTGILMLVINADEVTIKGYSASGWKSVGTEKVITKTKNSWVYTIDDQPAADVVIKYLGLSLTQEEAEKFSPGITVFSLQRNKGEPVLRSSAHFNWNERSILVNGNIKEGDRVRLTLTPDFDTVDQVISDAKAFKENDMHEADALVMFSCVGRHAEFGPMTGDEIDGIKNTFDVPLAGFFCYGEFGRATNGNNEFHNMTCCWIALKEN